jgi:hypothetical protein
VLNADGTNERVLYGGETGVQLYAPQFSPDGARILFGIFTEGTRDIASVAASGGDFRYEIRSENDERDARWTPDGGAVVFASDRTGVFNIYRMDVSTGETMQLTNVVGGAFMPDAAPDGAIVYAQYTATGYHVAVLAPGTAAVAALSRDAYALRTAGEFDECRDLRADAELGLGRAGSVGPGVGAEVASTSLVPALGAMSEQAEAQTRVGVAAPPLEPQPYKWDYTGFQFYPRLLVWDGTPRAGLFVATNEILDRQSLFFGGSYGVDGEFDLVFDFELRRLFPVIFMEYYKVRQKYEDQFPIEDLGRYYFIDYRYDVWSADLGLRFEFEDAYSLTRRNEIAVWWNHSEYNIFLEPEYTPLNDPTAARLPDQPVGWKYFVGNEARIRWSYKSITRAVDSDINPRGGREFSLELMYAMDDLFTSGEFEYGVNPDFDENRFGQYTVDWREYVALPGWRHTLQLRLMASFIDREVDDFFWVYMGGMDRLRGYTYYAIGGRKGALVSATYRFPIWRRINKQASWLTFKDVYGALFYEAAGAWNHSATPDDNFASVGGELRLNMGSFYSYPTTVNFAAAYALDDAQYENPVFEDAPIVLYDPQWRFYLNVGFGF